MRLFKEKFSRREFIKKTCKFLACLGASSILFDLFSNKNSEANISAIFSKEAMFYKKLDRNIVQCQMCFRGCRLSEGQRGVCFNRENHGGKLYSIVYSRPSAIHVDPIEKEPALHMLPSTDILCFGTAGCNFKCKFCHNWHLSQRPLEEMEGVYDLSPQAAVDTAIKKKIPTLSFTYNEPTSFYEYVYDTARIAKERGLRVLWHSNGSMNPEPLKELLKYTDSTTIDLKGFTRSFYQEVSSAELEPVLRTLKTIREEGKWLEIVNLQIPTLNDNPKDVEKMCYWIGENLGKDTPLHFSRFSPSYRLTSLPATPIETLERSHTIAKKCGLSYVTIGNVPGHKYNSTFCPNCNKNIILRKHFTVLENNVIDGKCKFCNLTIPGIWS
ncbi:AmmeMemoRadiSam system radical SAM enzyme [Candidatus Omnitrophota bacterium]